MTGLRITRMQVENVGVLQGHIDLGELDPAITLITGENETGKTTLVSALRCVLFERHDAKHATIRALQPHHTQAAPEVWVDYDLGGRRYALHKRFLRGAMAELTIDGVETHVGHEADEVVRNCLGSHVPGARGAKREDMGLWGLLWVSQDEAAFADPGRDLGDDTRGALQDAIRRQVGNIVSGRHGERLRSRVLEEARRYWTAAQFRPTGELAEAQQNVTALDEQVRRIRRAMEDVEDQARRSRALQIRVGEVTRERERLQAELAKATAETSGAERLQAKAEALQEARRGTEARLETARHRHQTRVDQVRQVAQLQERTAETAAQFAEMECILASRVEAAEKARTRLLQSENNLTLLKEKTASLSTRLERAQRAAETRENQQRLAQAKERWEQLQRLVKTQAEALDDAAYTHLRDLDGARRRQTLRLEAVGTRLRIRGPETLWEACFGRARRLDVPGLGAVHVQPAQCGLAQALKTYRGAAEACARTLVEARAETPDQARAQRRLRLELEVEAEHLTTELKQHAPAGVAILAEQTATGREALRRDSDALEQAQAKSEDVRNLHARIETLRVDEAVLRHLRDLQRVLDVARARQEAIATRINVTAFQDVEVALDGKVTPLKNGAEMEYTITKPTGLRLGDVAELRVSPGGEDVHQAEVRLAAAETALEEALKERDVVDLGAAEEQAREHRELQIRLRDAMSFLETKAPQGLEDLSTAVRDQRRQQHSREDHLAAAGLLEARWRQIEVSLEHNGVTQALLERIEAAAEALSAARADLETLGAGVRFEQLDTEFKALAEPAGGDLAEGFTWELLPGEGGAEEDMVLERLQHDLDKALKRVGVPDLAAAAERSREWHALEERKKGLNEQLSLLAPNGIEALQARVAELAGMADTAEPDVDDRTLTADLAVAREAFGVAEGEVAEARRHEATCAAERASFDGETRGKCVELQRDRLALADAQARLESARAEAADEDLRQRVAVADAAADNARTEAETAAQALQEAGPQLLQGEMERARYALEQNQAEERHIVTESASLKALLDRASTEGQFEALAEAESELQEAQDRLRRTQQAAAAAKLLAEEVERAYAATQARFLAPVVSEAKPYLNAIRPGTEIRMTPDLALEKVVRRGTEEDFGTLSGGTREQLSVIVRLALARVLSSDAKSTPLPLILDDTMGWTDDARFLQMARILRNASQEFQIIVLTCHPDRFARLQPGRTIELDHLRRAAKP